MGAAVKGRFMEEWHGGNYVLEHYFEPYYMVEQMIQCKPLPTLLRPSELARSIVAQWFIHKPILPGRTVFHQAGTNDRFMPPHYYILQREQALEKRFAKSTRTFNTENLHAFVYIPFLRTNCQKRQLYGCTMK